MGEPSTYHHQSDDPADDPSDAIYGVPSTAGSSLGDLISPDDWRLYHLMRELPNDDRARVIAFAELLFGLREAREKASGVRRQASGAT
jgi:hypothetical protein